MEEGLRRRYLKAMGIPLWLPREVAGERQPAPPAGPELAGVHMATPKEPETPPRRREAPPMTASAVPPPFDRLVESEVAALGWGPLAERVATCQACPDLVRNRGRTVFGVGNREARVMVIGEAPGVEEDRQGEPFVGRAGQLLNRMLMATGFPREQVFIANVLKCRPPNNRDPHQEEARRCEIFLMRQLTLVNPEVILSVGRISAQNLLKTDAPVGRMRGRLHYLGEARIPLVVTYHPAYLLRSPEQKAKAWDDLQLLLRTLVNG